MPNTPHFFQCKYYLSGDIISNRIDMNLIIINSGYEMVKAPITKYIYGMQG